MSYTPEQEQKWNRVIEALRESTPIQPFRLWIEPLRLITVTPTEVLAINENKNVPLEMARHAETRVNAILHTEFGRGVGFRVVDAAEIEEEEDNRDFLRSMRRRDREQQESSRQQEWIRKEASLSSTLFAKLFPCSGISSGISSSRVCRLFSSANRFFAIAQSQVTSSDSPRKSRLLVKAR